jgi:hypothetical protein
MAATMRARLAVFFVCGSRLWARRRSKQGALDDDWGSMNDKD